MADIVDGLVRPRAGSRARSAKWAPNEERVDG